MYHDKICLICGSPFQPNSGSQKTCGAVCFQSWRNGEKKTCIECGETFSTRRGAKARCCSRSCTRKNVHRSNPEIAKKSMAAARAAWARPDVAEKMKAWQLSPENPIHRAESRKKSQEKLRAAGWPNFLRYGKVPEIQQSLADCLGLPVDVPVRANDLNGRSRSRMERAYRPYWYLLDIANIELKMNVEIDGNSHRSRQRVERDRKRDSTLNRLGWTILRFSNRQVTENMAEVILKIQEVAEFLTSKRQAVITSQMAS